jgi:3-oxoacyl-[acyl-carrier-protein] synthase-3
MTPRAIITGTGRYIPPRIVTNFDLEKMMDTSDEWIRERAGIKERRYVKPGEATSNLGYMAALKAIESAQIDKSEIELIIAATLSPDHYFPGIGVFIQEKLGIDTIGALDVRNQCSGFIYALSVADQYIRAGTYTKILVVAAEIQSTGIDHSDKGRDISVLFGDGAGAVVVERNGADDGRGILSTHLFCEGKFATALWMEKISPKDENIFYPGILEAEGRFPQMDGKLVFKNASTRMPEAVRAALETNSLTIEDVDHLIPHQANDRISLMVARNLKIPVEKVIRNIDRYGNTTAASIPIALDEALEEGRIKHDDIVVLTAFGSGFTWASAAMKW